MMSPDYEIRVPRDGEIADLPGVELAAAQVIPIEDLGPDLRSQQMPVKAFEQAAAEGRLLVVCSLREARPVGFALMLVVDGSAHLHELDVEPGHARKGLGAGLLDEVRRWAAAQGHATVTLSTFRHLVWNAPFYHRHGYRELAPAEIGPELEAMLVEEEADGLDRSKRLAMRLRLAPTA